MKVFVRKFVVFVIVWLSLPASGFAQTAVSNQEVAAKVDEYMNALVNVKGFGGAVLVARDGKPIVGHGYGLANVELNVANTAQTKFRLGSLTKQFTAGAILLLQERGKLNVRDGICKYLQDCPAAWQTITIHQLLTHTSGIANITALADWEAKKTLPATLAQNIARFRDLPLEFKPGEQFKYSNSNYLLLGALVEKASGTSYEAFMKENVFAPLKMADTGLDHSAQILKNRAAGYSRVGETLVNASYIEMSIPSAAGALYSTVEDLLRWDQALYTENFLTRKSLDAMFTAEKNGYAYGWGVGTLNNRRYIAHTGGIEGFSAHISRFPDARATVIVLLNNDNAPANLVAGDLAAILFGENYEVPKGRRQITLDAKIYDAYLGQYEIAPGFALTITREGNKLMVQATGQPAAELFPESETKFFLRVVDAQITFTKEASGKVTGLILQQGGQNIPAKKIK
ncbi:MAG TPA: serine hydrolase [Pyrinomonadaceae bacterium]|jgi:CubicO group peptidase (beta-lactamase class C family)